MGLMICCCCLGLVCSLQYFLLPSFLHTCGLTLLHLFSLLRRRGGRERERERERERGGGGGERRRVAGRMWPEYAREGAGIAQSVLCGLSVLRDAAVVGSILSLAVNMASDSVPQDSFV